MSHLARSSSRPSEVGKKDEVSMKFIKAETAAALSGTSFSTCRYSRLSTVTMASASRSARISAPIRYPRPHADCAVYPSLSDSYSG